MRSPVQRSLRTRLVIPAGLIWVVCGTVCSTAGRPSWMFAAALGVIALSSAALAIAASRLPDGRWLVVYVAILLAAAGISTLRVDALRAPPVGEMAAQRAYVTAQVVLTGPVRFKPAPGAAPGPAALTRRLTWSAWGNLQEVREGSRVWTMRVPVLLTGSAPRRRSVGDLRLGATVSVQAVMAAAFPGKPMAAILSVRGPPIVTRGPPWLARQSLRVRSAMQRAAAPLPSDVRGLLPGLVVGDESRIPPDLVDDMRAVGMSHLTAVSGSNLAIVTGLVLLLANLCRLPRWLAVSVAGLALLGFVVVVGPQPSVLRAAVMGAIALLSLLSGRPKDGLSALAATAVLLVLIDPWLAVSAGFALSVAATGGLLLYASRRRWDERVEQADRLPARAKVWFVEALGVTVAAQLATAPIVAAIGAGLPIVGVPANLAAVPMVPSATILGFLAAALELISPGLGHGAAVLAGFPTAVIARVARLAVGVPGGVIPWPSGFVGFVLTVALLATAWWLWRHRDRLRAAPTRAVIAAVVAVLVMVTVRPIAFASSWPPRGWIGVVCDVGQGDATVLRSGDGHAVVVDAGPDPERVDRCLSDLGISAVDLLVLTHFHADHVEGLPGLMAGRQVGRILVSPLAEPPEEVMRVNRWLRGAGLKPEDAAVGERGSVGPISYRILWPTRLITAAGSAPNNASVTLLVDVGATRILLPGDVETPAQDEIIAAEPPVDADVIKLPHHGSRNYSPNLIPWAGATLAIASAGDGNTYGHPAASTLAAWVAAGARIGRTDTGGDIAIVVDANGSVGLDSRND